MSKKLTIIKILPRGTKIGLEDVERWRKLFNEQSEEWQKAVDSGEASVETLDVSEDDHNIMVVKIGYEGYHPTLEDLEAWRDLFEEAKNDPDFKIFTSPEVEISTINVGKIIDVE